MGANLRSMGMIWEKVRKQHSMVSQFDGWVLQVMHSAGYY
jgi:hypothetical protein